MSETPQSPERHEPPEHYDSEIRTKGVVAFVVGLLSLIVFAIAGIWALSHVMRARVALRDPEPPPLLDARRPPPRPRDALQTNPAADMTTFRAEQQKELDKYAWVDKQAGVAEIPIARAIDIAAAQGLPAPPAPPAAAQTVAARPAATPPPAGTMGGR